MTPSQRTVGAVLCLAALAILTTPAAAQKEIADDVQCVGCIETKELAGKAITRSKIKKKAVSAAKLKSGAVKTAKLKNGAVTADKIADGAVTADKLAPGVMTTGRSPISDCGTIAQAGSFVLVKDLPGPAGLNGDNGCLVIEADDVVLDLAGFSIIGNTMGSGTLASGIFMDSRRNVTIRNGTIRDFGGSGVLEDADIGLAENHQVSGLRVTGNGSGGIDLSGDNHQVTDCFAGGNGAGGIFSGNFARLVGNTALNNSAGDSGIASQSAATIAGNRSIGNGIGILPGSGSTVSGNTANDNAIFGIIASSNSTVTGNTASGNDVGIDARVTSLVVGNTAVGNTTADIDTSECPLIPDDCIIANNRGILVP